MEYQEQVTETETEHAEPLKDANAAIDDPKLVNTVQERLDNLRNITKEETAVSNEENDDSTSEVTDDNNAQESGQTESQTDSNDPTPAVEIKDEIPDAYIRAAIHQKWSQKDVDELVESNPDLAKRTFENCYNSVVQASKDFSEIGRAKIELDRQQVAKPTVAETVVQEDPKNAALIAKLRKEYVDDPLIEVVIKGLEKPVQQQQPIPQQQQSYEVATARANAAVNTAIDQRVNSFFDAGDMKLYEKFYGKLELGQIPEDLSNGQQYNRLAVLQEAEFIMAGHGVRGQKIEVEQALEKAHLIVTEPVRTQVVRDSLKTTATKRKKSMTLRPSDSKRSSDSMNTDSSKPRNRGELENAVQQKLDSVFKK